MTYADIEAAAGSAGLAIFGALHPETGGTLVLLGPAEPGFWQLISESPEYAGPDPVDRWSQRVIGGLAEDLGAQALFPFGGPPYQPFVTWALATGRVWQSPVSLMVHDVAGLFLSFRGALAFDAHIALPPTPKAPPCEGCARPCLTACPAGALTAEGYDLAACHAYLDQPEGRDCMTQGCAVRRSCPTSQSYGRLARQSAHHMRHFHKG